MPRNGPHNLHLGPAEQTNLKHRRALDNPATVQVEPGEHLGNPEEATLPHLKTSYRGTSIHAKAARVGGQVVVQHPPV